MKILSIITPITLVIASGYVGATPYVPVVDKTIILTKSGVSCVLPQSLNKKKFIDVCDDSGSIDVRMKISQMRSVPSSSGGVTTENKKYVSFIVGENAGAGIHVSNGLKQGHSWFESWTSRDDYLGGFSNKFGIKIEPISGYIPAIVRHNPKNENRNYQHRDTTGFTIGVNGTISAGVDATGPKAGAEIGASYSYTNSKTLVYDTKDFKVENKTSGSTFEVNYVFDTNICGGTLSTSGAYGCEWTDALWGKGYVYNASKINPIAYANFQPTMETIYEAPVSEQGTTDFKLSAWFEPILVYGKVRYYGFFQAGLGGGAINWQVPAQMVFRVNWGHPLFEGEAHVSLQSLDHNNACLDVYRANSAPGTKVSSYVCAGGWNQTWGLDSDERYHSRVGNNLCLTANVDKRVTVENCGNSLAQKWYWEGEVLVSRYVDGRGTKYVLDMSDSAQTRIVDITSSTHQRLSPRLVNISL